MRDSNVSPLPPADTGRRAAKEQPRESVISSDIVIEGRISGTGSVRLAGRFKGDVHVEGNVTLDAGAHVEGQIYGAVVVIGGELIGNIQAKRVELLETCVMSGDVKAGSLAVVAGARMRGRVEFGFENETVTSFEAKGIGSA